MKRKLHYFKIDLKEDRPSDSEQSFEETLLGVMQLNLSDRTQSAGGLSEDSIRLISFGQKGDHYRGIVAHFRASNAVTGSVSDERLNDLQLADGVSNG